MADATAYSSVDVRDGSLRLELESDLKGLVSGDSTAISHLIDLNISLFSRLDEMETNYKLSVGARQASEERLGFLMREMVSLRHENSVLEGRLAAVDDSTCQLNLRIEGLLEAENENIKDSVATCLSRSGIACTIEDIDYANRVGRYR